MDADARIWEGIWIRCEKAFRKIGTGILVQLLVSVRGGGVVESVSVVDVTHCFQGCAGDMSSVVENENGGVQIDCF